jgi:hypothetical protein
VAALKQIELELEGTKDLALIANDDSIWLVVPIRWWDLATLVWWVFAPSDRKAGVTLKMHDGSKVRFRAVRVASKHVRVRGFG